MARANGVITTEIILTDEIPTAMVFHVKDMGKLVLELNKVNADTLQHAAFHGLKQRISDAAAIPCDPDTGKPASAEKKYEQMKKLVEHYNTGGEWKLTREGGGGDGSTIGGITLRALAAVQGVEIGVMRERVGQLAEKKGVTSRALLKQISAAAPVQAKIAELKAAKAGPNADTLLDELQ